MDKDSGCCLGCARTIDEIVAWASMPNDEKRAVWAQLPERRLRWPQLGVERPKDAA